MIDEWQFTTPFLRGLSEHLRDELRKRRETWGIGVEEFYKKIETWFANFAHGDQPLALKLLLKLQYYSESDFKRGIDNFLVPIQQYLFQSGGTLQDLRLVVPLLRADSADRHAYDIIKAWGLQQDQVITVADLPSVEPQSVLVFFNDTHGTGNQFLREVFSQVKKENFRAIFVVAMTIAERALLRFHRELEGVQLLPNVPTPSIFDEFTAREVNRLRELGSQVYPKHPFGYGDAGLLVSYHFQCPNNTLPLIWADHKIGNNTVEGNAYPWAPLFPYRPKAKVESLPVAAVKSPSPDPTILDGAWAWTADERHQIERQIEDWGLKNAAFYKTASNWFRNFKLEERDTAREIFLATSYLNITKVRGLIRDFRKTLMAELGGVGGDMGDIILVTTGDEKNSVYHYMYEFMREWHLNIDQVRSLESLSPDRVIDKTLVFFYHTRAAGLHFEKHHSARLAMLTPRAAVFAAYAMSVEAKTRFSNLQSKSLKRVISSENISRTVNQIDQKYLDVIAQIEHELRPGLTATDPSTTFLSAYYFQCPADSSPLLWLNQAAAENRRPWTPLFHRISMPSTEGE